jgi:hypothetical protein
VGSTSTRGSVSGAHPINSGKRIQSRRAAALAWVASWRAEHEETFAALERAIATRSPETGSVLGHLKALDARAIDVLPRIIKDLADG